ncbi:hypothetical protein H5410_050701 [Solanum commersonii]|uniref:Uncharacterized protein n=1 Tax=Solanum commersonii TaxID=4109 RepID=A0A9J5WWA9_SOLCO|nr:hypothetical protein H5410_050701 [Solanum commersonii]
MVPMWVTLGPSIWSLTTEMGHCAEWCLRRNYGGERRDTLVGQIYSLRDGVARMGSLLRVWASGKATLTFVAKFLRFFECRSALCELVHLRGSLDIGLIRDGECSGTSLRASGLLLPSVAWTLVLPGHTAVRLFVVPLARVEARGSDGHIATPHSTTDAKVVGESEARVEREDGGYDGPGRSCTSIIADALSESPRRPADPQNLYAAADIASLQCGVEAILAALRLSPRLPHRTGDDV